MKLYSWRLFDYDCQCGYNVIAESLEEAREIILYDLTKNKSKDCVLCLIPEEPYDDRSLSFVQRMEIMNYHYNRGEYVIRNWIRDTEPIVHEAKKLFRG